MANYSCKNVLYHLPFSHNTFVTDDGQTDRPKTTRTISSTVRPKRSAKKSGSALLSGVW